MRSLWRHSVFIVYICRVNKRSILNRVCPNLCKGIIQIIVVKEIFKEKIVVTNGDKVPLYLVIYMSNNLMIIIDNINTDFHIYVQCNVKAVHNAISSYHHHIFLNILNGRYQKNMIMHLLILEKKRRINLNIL